ncbi:MAG: hypothetical protein AAB733_00950 [Patescibacteria group bacterium]
MIIFERLMFAEQKQGRSGFLLGAFLFLILGGIALIPQGVVRAETPPAPTLLSPQGVVSVDRRIEVTGLTWDGTSVAIYLDGVFQGYAMVYEKDPSRTAHFNYWLSANLKPGLHRVGSHAEFSEQGVWGSDAQVVSFWVPFPVPAPTLYTPVVNAEASATQPWIIGHAANDSRVTVYIDGKKERSFTVQNDASGTAFFKVKPVADLIAGSHDVSVVAENTRGLSSEASVSVTFAVQKSESGSINSTAASTEKVLGIETGKGAKKTAPDAPVSSDEDADTIDEEVTGSASQKSASIEEETANENINEADESEDSSTALWLVVIAVIVILIVIRLTGGGSSPSGMGGAMKKFFTEEGLRDQQQKGTGTGTNSQQPPHSPPPASNY